MGEVAPRGGGAPGPRRHDRVWLSPRWEAALAAPLAPGLAEPVAAWIAAGRSLVATRRDPARPGAVALGLALPPAAPARRIALAVDAAAVARIAPPLALGAALASAPAAWRGPLARLDAGARRAGVTLRVHGSLAWQHLAGAPYVTASSDVDLLARPRDAAALHALLALLAAADRGGGPRVDGEIILPCERAVAWRELAGGAARVLVRSADEVALLPRAVALGALAGGTP
jgi:phosphoribosyl-dephospho-CoA transferase